MRVCWSGRSADNTCGNITDSYPSTRFNVGYRDFIAHRDESKSITNVACHDIDVYPGDSGLPVYQLLQIRTP
jgi:hypothetical protein